VLETPSKLRLDVGCGDFPQGNVNCDLYLTESPEMGKGRKIDPKKCPNFVRSDTYHLPFRDFVGFLDSDGIVHSSFVEKAVSCLENNPSLLGVAAKKGIANPNIRIAKVKYRYKIYKKDGFQIDCSLFKAEAFSDRRILDRRSGKDSILIQSFQEGELAKVNVPYFHFERESVQAFFRDEFYGAYYGYKGNMAKTFFQILITPYTSVKMVFRNRWFLEGLLFPVRQFVWVLGFLLGVRVQR
jgi:hypothetical protein